MLVLGEREVKQNLVAPRARHGKTLSAMPIEQFIGLIKSECNVGGETYS